MSCSHKTRENHSRFRQLCGVGDANFVPGGQRVWKCSSCGTEEVWSDSWTWFGALECKQCGWSTIDFVACSKDCLDRLSKRRKPEPSASRSRR